MIQTCPKCQYQWDSSAGAEWITCPSCHRKFRPEPITIVETKQTGVSGICPICQNEGPIYLIKYSNNHVELCCDTCLNQ